jgi:hypothetical protein
MAEHKTLTQMIEILEPLTPEDRQRNINAALTYLGDPGLASAPRSHAENLEGSPDERRTSPTIASRMRQYNIANAHLEHVFDFRNDGSFALLDVAGTAKREQTLNTYILTGLGTYLATGERAFSDALARGNCEAHSCLDVSNHSKTLAAKHPEFNGDKSSGWTITIPGIRRGAELVKQIGAGPAK